MIDFKLDPNSGIPFYRQVIDQIRYGMSTGRLKVGEQLPTVRALAVELSINLNTVTKAYKELGILKILETHQGTGTFIGSPVLEISEQEKLSKIKSICDEVLIIASSYGFTSEDIISELQHRGGNNS